MTNIEELKGHCLKLIALLDDPEPGLLTWNEFLYGRLRAIAEFADLGAENSRLRAALEAAPQPQIRILGPNSVDPYDQGYFDWFYGSRAEALNGENV